MQVAYIDEPVPIIGSSGDHRPSGIHVSGIIKSMLNHMGTYANRGLDWDKDATFAIGYLWEEVLSRAFAESQRPHKIGPQEEDGIILTPDGFSSVEDAVEEYKATWRSIRNALPPDVWEWMIQAKSYCHVCRTRKVIFRVFYINGDYKGSGPTYKRCDITYTPAEIAENWKMVVNHARYMEEMGE